MSQVCIFKMVNGQEIIAKIMQWGSDAEFLLENVREIAPVPVQGPEGRQGFKLTLAPFIFSLGGTEKSMLLSKTAIMARSTELPDALEKEYLSSVSGLIIPKGIPK